MRDPIFTHKSYEIDQKLLDKTSHVIAFYIQLVANHYK